MHEIDAVAFLMLCPVVTFTQNAYDNQSALLAHSVDAKAGTPADAGRF